MHSPATSGRVLAGPAVGAARFSYHRARHPDEVDELLAEHGPQARILAGGTDLLVQMRAGVRRPQHVVDVADLAGLSTVSFTDGRLRVGAGAALWRIEELPVVRERFAALYEGARCVGSLQIQSRATLAGNACNASPAADTSPALLLYDAVMGIRSAVGKREVPITEFWSGPGGTTMRPGEWVEHITLSDPGPHGSCYVKLGRTRGVDLALVAIACLVGAGEVRVACASLASSARRLGGVAELLRSDPTADSEAVDTALAAEISPISDIRASSRYRLAMAGVCTRRAHSAATARRDGGAGGS